MIELSYIEKIALLILTFIVLIIATNVIGFYFSRILKKLFHNRYASLISTITQYSITILGLYYINVHFFKFEFGVLASSLGIVSIAIAYSSQQFIQNIISGLIISFEGLISVDDWVEVPPMNVIGKVKKISFLRVTLRDISGKIHIIPNSLLMTTRVINYTTSNFVEVQLPIGIKPAHDYAAFKKIVLEVALAHPKVLPRVPKATKSEILRLFKLGKDKEFQSEKDLERFAPSVMISDIGVDKVTVMVHMWISDIKSKDQIISDVLTKIKEQSPLV